MGSEMSKLQTASLTDLETVIERGMATFMEVGAALAEIQKRRLYKEQGYTEFDAYCKERWGWARQNAYQLIAAASAAENVRNCVHSPTSEGQIRPLTRLETPSAQRQAWQRAVEIAREERGETAKITGRHVARAVREIANPVAGHIGPKTSPKRTNKRQAAEHIRTAIRELQAARKLLPDGQDESRIHATIKTLTNMARTLENKNA